MEGQIVTQRFAPRGFNKCPHCGSFKKLVRIDLYDRIACRNCLRWVQPQCRCGGQTCTQFPDQTEDTTKIWWDDPQNTVYKI